MSADPLAVVVDFLERWSLDRDRGTVRDAEYYASSYPGYEDAVRAEHARLTADAAIHDGFAADGAGGSSGADPARIGPYEIVRLVGEGGQGAVYEAKDLRLGRRVAIKVLNGLGSPGALARLRREASLLAALDHPALCTLYEAGLHGERAYLAMRFVEGRSLADVIRAQRDVGPGPAALPGCDPSADVRERTVAILRMLAQVARALDAAHGKGVVHRDVKPGNIVLDGAGDPVVLDFGLARGRDGDSEALTIPGDVLGTPAYLAPERLAGRDGDLRVDVYALGVTLYECLTLRRPFEAPTREGLFRKILEDPPPDPRPLNRAVERDLVAVLETALAKDPDRRYASATALAHDLEAVAARRPVAVRRAGVPVRAWRWALRRRTTAALLATACVVVPVIAALGGYIAARRPDLDFAATKRTEIRDENALLAAWYALEEGGRGAAAPLFAVLTASPYVGVDAVAGLTLAHLRDDAPEKALEALDIAPAGTTSPGFARLRRRALEALGRPCPEDVARCADSSPADPFDLFVAGTDLLNRIGGVAIDAEAWAEAHRLLTRAAVHPRGRTRYHFARARVFAALGASHAEEARDAARILQECWPDSGFAWHRAGLALSRVDPEASRAAYARAFELLPEVGASLMEPVRRNRKPAPHGASRPVAAPDGAPSEAPKR